MHNNPQTYEFRQTKDLFLETQLRQTQHLRLPEVILLLLLLIIIIITTIMIVLSIIIIMIKHVYIYIYIYIYLAPETYGLLAAGGQRGRIVVYDTV